MAHELREGLLLGMGNPLLDISAIVHQDMLVKYDMKPNDAILAEEKHKTLNEELIQKYNAEYIAGGSVQNSLRVAQWIIEKPLVTTYFGCVGKDKFSDILEKKARECGVNAKYQIVENMPTGTCSVLITGTHRSLCADLSAANCFTIDHIRKPENQDFIEKARYYYVSGFFLTVSPPSIMEIAKFAHTHNRPFLMNLSAPFLAKFFKEQMMEVMPYVDVLFGNEEEAITFATEQNFSETSDLEKIALMMCDLPKISNEKTRVVVITHGPNPVILAYNNKITLVPVKVLPPEKMVDTNGAGDAFAGGFLAQYIQNKPLEICVQCAIYTASEIIQQSGCTFVGKSNFVPSSCLCID